MDAVTRVLKFGLGGVFGAALGAGVASLLAPQRGEELQRASRVIIEEAKADGNNAQALTESVLTERFRQQVNDPDALTGTQKPENA